ncbi:glycosyltransferase family 4 protein [Micromonospora chokoriensis]
MRIVYLHQYFRTPAMAGGTRSYEFARRLVASGHEVHVVTSDVDTVDVRRHDWRTTIEAGATVHWAAVPYHGSMSYRSRIRSFFQFAQVAAVRAARIDQDVVLATSTPLTIAIPAIYSARRRRVPMVLEIRDVWPEVPIALGALRSPLSRYAAQRLERFAYQNARQVIALSPGMADSIRRRFPKVPVTVVPNACDRSLFATAEAAGARLRAELAWLGDRPLVLYAGTLGYVNHVEYLVRVAAAARKLWPALRFAVIGDGPEKAHVRSVASELGVLGQNFVMFDPLPKSDVVAFFGASTLAISTVRDEPVLHANSANKVFDTWAAGRPVAINHEGWIADTIRESGAGVVLPATDHDQAARMLVAFVTDPARVSAARQAAQTVAQTRFDRDLLFQRFEQTLWEAVGTTTRPS